MKPPRRTGDLASRHAAAVCSAHIVIELRDEVGIAAAFDILPALDAATEPAACCVVVEPAGLQTAQRFCE